MRTPDPVVPLGPGWATSDGEALGECADCAAVVSYDPEAQGGATSVLCRGCVLAALGLDWS